MNTKQALLLELEKNKGTYISGGTLASRLSISRNAVSKACEKLRQEGYPIESVTGRGYMLAEKADILSEEAVRLHLERKDVVVITLNEVDSTNKLLARLFAQAPLPGGSLATADMQTKGRGHLDHSFYSPAGTGLYVSVLLRGSDLTESDRMPGKGAPTLTARAAVAAARCVEKVCHVSPSIKWVNDLFYDFGENGKEHFLKIGGLLTEAKTDYETGIIDYVIVGFGLNLRDPEGGFGDLKDIAGSIRSVVPEGVFFDRNMLAAEFCNELLRVQKDDDFMKEYIERSFLPGRNITVSKPFAGKDSGPLLLTAAALSVTEEGKLRVRYENGETEDLMFGDVSLKIR